MVQDELVPPKELDYVGHGDFKSVGNEFLNHFINLGKLQPYEKVLDVGSGIGRMAVPLTRYLNGQGSYHGFDIVKPVIDWCRDTITSKFPNFRFQWVDLYNKCFNPRGRLHPARFKFPYPDQTFDFVFLVFTHMFTRDMENYLQEIARTLKINGRCLITFFLMNQESARLVYQRKSTICFQFAMGPCYSNQTETPEWAISHDELFVRRLFDRSGLQIQNPIHCGNWCERQKFLSYQDIVVARKTRHVQPKSTLLRLLHSYSFPRRFRKVRNWKKRYGIPA